MSEQAGRILCERIIGPIIIKRRRADLVAGPIHRNGLPDFATSCTPLPLSRADAGFLTLIANKRHRSEVEAP